MVGWAISAINDRHLAMRALAAALKLRCPDSGLMHHSDQGGPYASEDYQTVLAAQGITCSMSRRGNCYDNAVMESFFSSVKSELSDRFDSCGEAKMELSTTRVFYNQRRRHSTIRQISRRRSRRRGRLRRHRLTVTESGQCHPPKKCASTSPALSTPNCLSPISLR